MGAKRLFTSVSVSFYIIFLAAVLFQNSKGPNYLNEWDERFHALVAKNLVEDLSVPLLYKDKAVTSYDYGPWYRTHIWLHKPPLYSYQAAFIMSVFDNGLWGYRLHGLLVLGLLIFVFYKLLRTYQMDLWPSLLIATGSLFGLAFLRLSNGVLGMGQNDLTFILWISVGVFFAERARLEGQKQRFKNILLVALFSAMAVLTKFLVGYLPFLILGLSALIYRWSIKDWFAVFLGAFIPVLFLGAWYSYTFQIAPELTLSELSYNTRHFNESLESHSQDWLFHIKWFVKSFLIPLALLLALLLLTLWKREKKARAFGIFPKAFWAPFLATLFVLVFFMVAKTKLPAFSFVSAPLLIMMIGVMYQQKIVTYHRRKWLLIIPLIGVLWGSIYVLSADYSDPKRECQHRYFVELGEVLPSNAVLFNVESFNYPEAMFYSGLVCYEGLPSRIMLEEAEAQGYIPYLLIRGNETENLLSLFQSRALEYPCTEK